MNDEKPIRATIPMCPLCGTELVKSKWDLPGPELWCKSCGILIPARKSHWGHYPNSKETDNE